MWRLLPWLGACDRAVPPAEGIHTLTLDKPLNIVDLEGLPNVWSAAAGWGISSPTLCGDLNNDGWVDLAVIANDLVEPFDASATLFVSGPLRRPGTLPGDEAARLAFDEGGLTACADATGDGITDIVVATYGGLVLYTGPFGNGDITEGPGLPVPAGGSVADIDGDGVLDVWTLTASGDVTLTWGPSERWSEPPDTVLDGRDPQQFDSGGRATQRLGVGGERSVS